jgi:fumarate reductase subunit D
VLVVLHAEMFSYERIYMVVSHPLIKLVLFGILFLGIWHAAHRLRLTMHDFGLRADGFAVLLFYGMAVIATIFMGYVLIIL